MARVKPSSELALAMSVKSLLADSKVLTGLLLIMGSAQFLTVMMIGEAVAPDYSMHANAISDLGVIKETRTFFNPSMFIVGLLNLVAGYFFFRVHGSRILLCVFGIGGIGAMGAALFPLDSPVKIHGLFALLAFLFMNIEALLGSRLFKGPLTIMSVVAGITGLIFLVMMVLVDGGSVDVSGSIGHGGTERMIAYPVLIWLVIVGGYLLGGPAVRMRESTPGMGV